MATAGSAAGRLLATFSLSTVRLSLSCSIARASHSGCGGLQFRRTGAHLTCMCLTCRRLVLTDHRSLETSSTYLQSIDGRALAPPALPAFVQHLVTFVGELQSLLIADCEASSESWPAGVYPSL